MSPEQLKDIRQYREDVRSGSDMRDPSYESEIIDSLLDEVARLRGTEPEDSAAPPVVAEAAGSPRLKGSITRLAFASLLDNPNPWIATCGWCSTTAEVAKKELRMPQDLEAIGWHLCFQFGYLCPKCQPIIESATLENQPAK